MGRCTTRFPSWGPEVLLLTFPIIVIFFAEELESDDNLVEFIEDNFGKLCVASDDELFAQFDSDDSFSLESLDREIREAGLDPPNW